MLIMAFSLHTNQLGKFLLPGKVLSGECLQKMKIIGENWFKRQKLKFNSTTRFWHQYWRNKEVFKKRERKQNLKKNVPNDNPTKSDDSFKGRVHSKRLFLWKPSVFFIHMDVCNKNSKKCFVFQPEHFREEITHPWNSNSTSREQ